MLASVVLAVVDVRQCGKKFSHLTVLSTVLATTVSRTVGNYVPVSVPKLGRFQDFAHFWDGGFRHISETGGFNRPVSRTQTIFACFGLRSRVHVSGRRRPVCLRETVPGAGGMGRDVNTLRRAEAEQRWHHELACQRPRPRRQLEVPVSTWGGAA